MILRQLNACHCFSHRTRTSNCATLQIIAQRRDPFGGERRFAEVQFLQRFELEQMWDALIGEPKFAQRQLRKFRQCGEMGQAFICQQRPCFLVCFVSPVFLERLRMESE